MLENIIIGILDFLKSPEFVAVMASLLAIWQIIKGYVGKFAAAKAKVKEQSYISVLTNKEVTIKNIMEKYEELQEMYLDVVKEARMTRKAIENIVEAQKVAFNNANLNASAKLLITQILERDQIKDEQEDYTKKIKENHISLEEVLNPLTTKNEETKKRWVN